MPLQPLQLDPVSWFGMLEVEVRLPNSGVLVEHFEFVDIGWGFEVVNFEAVDSEGRHGFH